MVVHAEVVVDPQPCGPDGVGVEARHFADVGEEGRLAWAVAGRAFDARGAGEAAPCAAGHLLRCAGEAVSVPERRLELEARLDADAPQVGGVVDETRGVFAVPRHRRERDAGRKPDFVAGAAVFRERLERRRPLRVIGGMRCAEADLEEIGRWVVHARMIADEGVGGKTRGGESAAGERRRYLTRSAQSSRGLRCGFGAAGERRRYLMRSAQRRWRKTKISGKSGKFGLRRLGLQWLGSVGSA